MRRRPLRRPEALPDPGTSRCDQGGMRLARNPRADLDRCLGEPRLERLSRTRRSDEPLASARRQGSLRGGDATPPWSTRRWSLLKRIAARPGKVSGRYVTGHDRRMAPRERTMTIQHQAGRTCGEHFRSAWRHGILPASRRKGRARLDVPRMFPGTIPSVLARRVFRIFIHVILRGTGGARTHDRRIKACCSSDDPLFSAGIPGSDEPRQR